MKQIKKEDLPVKICQQCQRPFQWRKKWARIWSLVKYCSKRCRTQKYTQTMELIPPDEMSVSD